MKQILSIRSIKLKIVKWFKWRSILQKEEYTYKYVDDTGPFFFSWFDCFNFGDFIGSFPSFHLIAELELRELFQWTKQSHYINISICEMCIKCVENVLFIILNQNKSIFIIECELLCWNMIPYWLLNWSIALFGIENIAYEIQYFMLMVCSTPMFSISLILFLSINHQIYCAVGNDFNIIESMFM